MRYGALRRNARPLQDEQPIRETAPHFPADRARRTPQKPADLQKARPTTMLRQNHATFLAVEVGQRNASHIALYDYQTTDCRIAFEKYY
ncbi:MAG: hypothetical protein ACJAWC_003088 [Yoonia sp.]